MKWNPTEKIINAGGPIFIGKYLSTNVMQFVSDLAIKPGGYYYYSRSVFINIYISFHLEV
jgi:hypothetical protein